jgi:hypothetical protein
MDRRIRAAYSLSFFVRNLIIGWQCCIQTKYLNYDRSYIDKDVYEGSTDTPHRRSAGMLSQR